MSKSFYLLVVSMFLGCNLLSGQTPPAWGGGADQNDFSAGFYFSYVVNNYKIIKKPNWRSPFFDTNSNKYITDSLNSISSGSIPGFAIGFLGRYRLTEHLEARVTPRLVFADRSLNYTYATPSENVTKTVQTTTVDFPLLLKLKSDRVGDFRAYIVGGVKYSAAIGSKSNSDADLGLLQKMVKNSGGYGSYEIGLGCDIYFEYFKFSPEIKLSNSFSNILVPENQPFSSPISKLFLHTITFNIYFE